MNLTMLFGACTLMSGLICLGISAFLAPFRHHPSARYLLLMMAGVALWGFGYGMEFMYPDLSTKLFWVPLEYFGSACIPIFFFKFILSAGHRSHWLTRGLNLTLLPYPFLAFLAGATNDFHGFFWKTAWLETVSGIQVILYQRGWLFWVHVGFCYGLLLWSTLLLIKEYVESKGMFKNQFAVIMVGLTVPWFNNILYLFSGPALKYLDLTPVSFTIAGFAFVWGVTRYQILNLIPMAHKAIMENMGDPVIVLDTHDRVMTVNTACTDAFGIPRFIPGKQTLEGLFPDLAPIIHQNTSKKPSRTEAIFLLNGVFRHWDVSISPLKTDSYASKGRLVVLRDITLSKQAEAELRQARDYVRSIINSMPSLLVGVDDRAMVTQWNHEAEKKTGIAAGTARDKKLGEVFSQLSDIIPDIERAIQNRQVTKKEKTPLVFRDRQYLTDIAIYPIQSGDTPGAVIRIDDISERAKIEEMMVHSEKMMSVGGLAAGMAHEINNPLAGIIQNIQVVRNRLTKPLPANVKTAEKLGVELDLISRYMEERNIFHLMEQAVKAGKRAARIVENMLSFSRKSESRYDSHCIMEMMASTLDLVKNDFTLKKRHDFLSVKINNQTMEDLPKVPCDRSKIQQVFFNIIKNGVEAMSGAHVASPEFVIRYFTEGGMACVEIRDNGPGIPYDIQKRIFEPFFTTKEVGIGTGLGLSVSYFIIKENHGGELNVSSLPGKGTAFIVKLPAP